MFNVIIAGSRTFDDYECLKSTLDVLFKNLREEVVIICGAARGADALGERYAKSHGYEIRYFPADWQTYGRAAGPIRNKEMAQSADALVAFWDGKSPGTKNMINLAKKYGLKIRIKYY